MRGVKRVSPLTVEKHQLTLSRHSFRFPEPYEHAKLRRRIVAIGGQSAGKSALVSMLTGIKLESSTSATTRGPTVFRFAKGSGPTAAKIWVEIVEDIDGKALPQMIKEKETVVSLAELPEKHREYARLVLNAE
jgi:GTPase SAR1 family protein